MTTPQKPKSRGSQSQGKASESKDASIELEKQGEQIQIDQIQGLLDVLKPIIQFHKETVNLTANDVRLYYDVRVIRGNGQPFAHLQSSITWHEFLSPTVMALATTRIQNDLVEQIVIPLSAKIQAEVQRKTFEDLAARGRAPGMAGITVKDLISKE